MNKNTLDIFVTLFAFLTGMVLSIFNNPLLGVGALLVVVTSWNVAPKLIKAKAAQNQ